ncbi:hypothetical protein [Parasphingorhabdus pacifica]
MAIDRAARARRRQALRAVDEAAAREPVSAAASATLEVEGLFNAGARHRLDQMAWVAVAKEDDREAGSGPLDLDSGVVRISSPFGS